MLMMESAQMGVAAPAAATALRSWLRRWRAVLRDWRVRSESRAVLRGLDPHVLRDIGVTPAAAAREAARPFWEK